MKEEIRAEKLVADLVRIESINPQLVPGGSGEGAVARYVADLLRRAGMEARLMEAGAGRLNVVGILRGRGKGRSLMLNGHLDTVGVEGMAEPFSARVEKGRLYGRGAEDMKGGLAAALLAAAELAGGPRLPGDLIVAGVADEEYQSGGTRALLKKVRADAAIVMEPTALEVATAHKGFAWAEIETRGRAAHGSRPEEGRDAIAFMGRVLGKIENLQARLEAGTRHPLVGCGSVHASLISGGQELSSYPEKCRLSAERRLIPGEEAGTFEEELREILARLKSQDPRFSARITMGYAALPLETARESPIARMLLESARKVIGRSAKFGAQSFWTDAALLNEAGIPSVLFGPGGGGLHSKVEFVKLEDVRLCSETLVECARAFCGSP
jgi:acetylornithine deacetylase/succinyl-diaminopimelate desuccinylase family protein